MRDNSNKSCDRRILRAFYTQYVAVLLIMLVFTIGAFQQRTAGSVNQRATVQPISPVSSVVIESPFSERGELIRGYESLDSVSHMLREHDLRAVVTLPLASWTSVSEGDELQAVVRRIGALEAFLSERGVALDWLTFVVADEMSGTAHLRVDFVKEEHDTFLL